MKKIQKFAMAFLLGAMTFGFTACSDDNGGDDEIVNIPAADMSAATKTYVDDVVYPTYQALAANAQTLYTKAQALYAAASNGTMTQAQIDETCEAFKGAREQWERSEAFLYGSAENNEFDPHIDSWPLDHQGLVDVLHNATLIAGFKSADPAKFVGENNGASEAIQSVLGFHGMEFVLFRDGANRKLADLQAEFDNYTDMKDVKNLDELAFLQAVAGDVRNVTAALEFTWMGEAKTSADVKTLLNGSASYLFENLPTTKGLAKGQYSWGEWLQMPGDGTGFGTTWQATLAQIFVGGCSNICNEVQEQKLGQAYRVANGTGTAEETIDYIESPYSQRSFVDYKDNIYSIKNSLYGTRDINAQPVANSIMNIMKNSGYPRYSALQTALTEALASFDAAIQAQGSFVAKPGSAAVKNCIDKVKALDDELNAAGQWVERQNAI